MVEQLLTGKNIGILISDEFEQIELTSPKEALEAAGANVSIISVDKQTVTGLNHITKADTFEVDYMLEDSNLPEFDGLVVPGGVVNSDHLRVEPSAQQLIVEMDDAEKPLAVICHGPWLLASAGILKDRTVTSYHTLEDDLTNAGADWVDQEVVIDRNLITSRNPDDLDAFNQTFIDALVAE